MAVSKKAGSKSAKSAGKKTEGKRSPKQVRAAKVSEAQPAGASPEKKRIVNVRKSLLALLFFIILALILFFAFRGDPMRNIPRMTESAHEDLAAGKAADAIRRLNVVDSELAGLLQDKNTTPESRIYALLNLQRQANELRKFAELAGK